MALYGDATGGNIGLGKKLRADALCLANAEPALDDRLSRSAWPRDAGSLKTLRHEALAIMQQHFAAEHPDVRDLQEALRS